MRNSLPRFASEPPVRVRDLDYLDIFLFDLRPTRQPDDERIANERIRSLSSTEPYLKRAPPSKVKIGARFEWPFNPRELGPVPRAPANDPAAQSCLAPADLNRSTAMPRRG